MRMFYGLSTCQNHSVINFEHSRDVKTGPALQSGLHLPMCWADATSLGRQRTLMPRKESKSTKCLKRPHVELPLVSSSSLARQGCAGQGESWNFHTFFSHSSAIRISFVPVPAAETPQSRTSIYVMNYVQFFDCLRNSTPRLNPRGDWPGWSAHTIEYNTV